VPTVALFVTCVADQLFPDTAMATVRVLERAGFEVAVPSDQTCCGQPAISAGQPEAAARLADHFLDVFAAADAIVAPSGSCAAMVHHWYARLLPERASHAKALAEKTYEFAQFVVDVSGVTDVGSKLDGEVVTVHDACHGLRNLGVGSAPRKLLAAAGASLAEMDEPETCCGFGGVFATAYPEVSARLADAKLGHAGDTHANWLVSTDLACLMHLEGRRRRTAVGPRAVHLADLLAVGLDR
jgi:L-lactate dehydrogenase complex protein LldE